MSHIEFSLAEPVPESGTYLFPVAPDTHEQRVLHPVFKDCRAIREVQAINSQQRAYVLLLNAGDRPVVRYYFEEPGPGLPDWAFVSSETRYDRASPALADEIWQGVPDAPSATRVPALMQFIADRFTYGNRPQYLGSDTDAMPALGCDINTGNCVDMHTLGVSALRVIGVDAVYVIGCFVYVERAEFPTGHCWLNLRADGAPHHYDISHHVEYGLGPVTPALNPKPGRRFAMAFGRGLQFDGADGLVEFPSLSGFQKLDGSMRGQKLRTIGQFG
ncbi:MAG: transglutaminase domain-containing protein [Beijerinckiaceae bacterium]